MGILNVTNGLTLSPACHNAAMKIFPHWQGDKKHPTIQDFAATTAGKVLDSLGKIPSGVFRSGDLEWIGNKEECNNVAVLNHCVVPFKVSAQTWRKSGHLGICIPKVCSKADA